VVVGAPRLAAGAIIRLRFRRDDPAGSLGE
jgi:hypothetical protein